MPRAANDFDERKITSYLVSKLLSGEEVCIICKRKIPKGPKDGFHYNVSKHMALWHGKLYDIRNKSMLDLVERYKKRARKQNREGPEEEPDSTAGLQLQAAAIELPDRNSLNDVGSEDEQPSRQVEGEAPPGSSRGNEDLVELFLPTPPTPDSTAGLQLLAAAIELSDRNSLNDVGSEDEQPSRQVEGEAPPGSSRGNEDLVELFLPTPPTPDSTAGLQLLAAAIELSDRNSLNDVGSEDQQPSRQVEGEAPPGSSSRVKKNKFSSLPAPSKESLQRLLKRIDDETSSKVCKQEVVVPMPRINATEEHDVLPPPPAPAPAPAPAPPALPPAAAVPVNDDYRIHVINRFVDLALGLYRQ
ncbi:hypothetical protein DMENIID0001_125400 [Sergentomyia squamirostris]